MRRMLVLALVALAAALPRAQAPSLEYRVKAAYLYNFMRFVEWPESASSGPLTICVAARNPFGSALEDTIRDETIDGRLLTTRTIRTPASPCHVLFIPDGVASGPYLRAALGAPVLTVGESAAFIREGGMIRFVIDGENVRFEINPRAAEQAQLRISSRLLQLARIVTPAGEQ